MNFKRCIKVLTFCILLINANGAFSQKKIKDKKDQKEQPVLVVAEPVYEITESAPVQVMDVSDSYDRYSADRINDDTNWVYDRYRSDNRKYGISKRGKLILPMLFDRDSYNTVSGNNAFCMGIGANYGLYNIEKEKW